MCVEMAIVQRRTTNGTPVIEEDPHLVIERLLQLEPFPPPSVFQEIFGKSKDMPYLLQTALTLCRNSNQYEVLLHYLERRTPLPHPSSLRDALLNSDTLKYMQACGVDVSPYESDVLFINTPDFCIRLLCRGDIDAARVAFSRYHFPLSASVTTNILHAAQSNDLRTIGPWLNEFIQIVVEQEPERTIEIVEWVVEILHQLQVDPALKLAQTVLSAFEVVPKNLALYHPSQDTLVILEKHLLTIKRLRDKYKINFLLKEIASLEPIETLVVMLHRCFTEDIKTLCQNEISQAAAVRGVHIDDVLKRYADRSLANESLSSERILALLKAFTCPRRRAECVVNALRAIPAPCPGLARVAEEAATSYPNLAYTIRTLIHLPRALPKLHSRWRRTAFKKASGEREDWCGAEGTVRLLRGLRAPKPPRSALAAFQKLPPRQQRSLLKSALVAYEMVLSDRFCDDVMIRNFVDFLKGTNLLDASALRDVEMLYQLKVSYDICTDRNGLRSKPQDYEIYFKPNLCCDHAFQDHISDTQAELGASKLIASKFNYIHMFSKDNPSTDDLTDFYSNVIQSEDTIAFNTHNPMESDLEGLKRLGRRARELAALGVGAEALSGETCALADRALRGALSARRADRLALLVLARAARRPLPALAPAAHSLLPAPEPKRARLLRHLLAAPRPATTPLHVASLARAHALPLPDALALAVIAKLVAFAPQHYEYVDGIGQTRTRLADGEAALVEECEALADGLSRDDEFLTAHLKRLWEHGETEVEGVRAALSPYSYEAYLCVGRLWWRGGAARVAGGARARLLLRLLQRYARHAPPAAAELDALPTCSPLAQRRLHAHRLLNDDVWPELKQEVTLDNYEQWLAAIPLLSLAYSPRVASDMLASSALKRSMTRRQRAREAQAQGEGEGEWALHAREEPLVVAAHRAVASIDNTEWAAASLFYAVRGAPPGPDRVAAADLCAHFTRRWVEAARGSPHEQQARDADRSIRARRRALAAAQILHRMGRADAAYLRAADDPPRLLRALHLDARYAADALLHQHNALVDLLADATDVSAASVRIELLEGALDRRDGGALALSAHEVTAVRRILSAIPLVTGAMYLANAIREEPDVGRRLRATQCLLALDDEALAQVGVTRGALWRALLELEARGVVEACGGAWGGGAARAVREACGALAPRAAPTELRALGALAVRWRCASGPLLAALERAQLLESVCEVVAGRPPPDALWERALVLAFERVGEGGEAGRARCAAAVARLGVGWGARADSAGRRRVAGGAWVAARAARCPALAAPLLAWAGGDGLPKLANDRRLRDELRALAPRCALAPLFARLLDCQHA